MLPEIVNHSLPPVRMVDVEHPSRAITVQQDIAQLILYVNRDIERVTIEPYRYHENKSQSSNQSRGVDYMPTVTFSRDTIATLPEQVGAMQEALGGDWNLLFHSEVSCTPWGESPETRYIPMMDFAVPVSEEGLHTVNQFVENALVNKEFGPFIVFESGNSYHVVGIKLLTDEQRLRFYASCLTSSGEYGQRSRGEYVEVESIGKKLLTLTSEEEILPSVACFIPSEKVHDVEAFMKGSMPELAEILRLVEKDGYFEITTTDNLKRSDYIKFLGLCLLINDRHMEPPGIIDSRYIGHMLRGIAPSGVRMNQSTQKPSLPQAVS